MRNKLVLWLAVLAGFAANVQAASVVCPNPGRIQQSADFNYSATAPDGQTWHGEQAGTAKVDLTTYAFTSASIAATTIACHYKSEGGVALTLHLGVEGVEPGSQKKWKDGYCASDKVTGCAFVLP